MTGTATVLRADARYLPLPDDSVDLIVTSPPYFALRSYTDGGEHYEGQVGSEATPAEFVDALLEVTAECVRVLKPTGSLWVNLGDKYVSRSAGLAKRDDRHIDGARAGARDANPRRPPAYKVAREQHVPGAMRDKSLMGLPWRYAIRCMDELGLILRSELVWSKPNGLPESVTDRVRRSHEQWFHFTLEPRYYSAVDEIREAYDPKSLVRIAAGYNPTKRDAVETERNGMMRARGAGESAEGYTPNALGKLPGSVWSIPTEPLRVPDRLGVDHFAAFPTEWPRRLIAGWSPAGICVDCEEGRRPVVHTPKVDGHVPTSDRDLLDTGVTKVGANSTLNKSGGLLVKWRDANPSQHLGYACACPEPTAATRPAVVLDPFGGTGTTAMVAKALGRHGITVDMSADYCRVATWRTNDRDQLAKVLGVAKSPQEPADAPNLLDLL